MNVVVSLLVAALFAAGPIIKPRSIHETLARDILINLNLGQYEAATRDFNASLREAITPAGIAELKKQFDTDVGAFRSVVNVREAKEKGFPLVELTARFVEADVMVKVVFDADNRIAAVYFNPLLPAAADPRLEAIARGVLTNFNARQFDLASKSFDAQLKAQLTAARMATLSDELAARYGQFRSVRKVRQLTQAPLRNIDLIGDWEKQPAVMRVVFNEAGLVVGLHVSPYIDPRAQ